MQVQRHGDELVRQIAKAMALRDDLNRYENISFNEVHVWHADHDIAQPAMDAFFKLLSDDERARAARFKVAHAYKEFVISHGILRTVLGRYLRIEPGMVRLQSAAHGKPELAEASDLKFNLSHTEGKTAMAITKGRPVGVDVERVRQNLNPLELAQRFFSSKEAQWLQSQPIEQRFSAFFACWTAKEAYIKACGEGLSMPLSSFGVRPQLTAGEVEFQIYGKPEVSRRWSLWQLDFGPDFKAAVAVEGQSMSLQIRHFSK